MWPTTALPKMALNVGFNHSKVTFYSYGGICFSLLRSNLNLRFSIVEFLSWTQGINLLELRASLQTIFYSYIATQKKC